MRINKQNNQSFKSLSPLAKPLGSFYNANATIPTLIIESGVTLGRANEANKRGGMPEAVDRLVEQGVGAIVWIYGVKILKTIGDTIGKKILKIDNFNFDIGFDELRNPFKNIKNDKLMKKAFGYKAGNLLVSTALATYFMGAILPKINNAILKKTLAKDKANKNQNEQSAPMPTFKDFQNNTGKNISFTSAYDIALNSAHILENNSTARLFITDTGVIAGRFANAKNKYRKIEGLFRDIASIYFYLRASSDTVKFLNKLTSNTGIDPKALEKTVKLLKENPNLSIKKANESDLSKLKELFNNSKTITVDEFIELFPHKTEKAKQMAKMQYIESGNGILSFQQASDVLSDSPTSEPKFLKETFDYIFDKDIKDKLCYVSSKKLNEIRNSIDKFIEQVQKEANGKEITEKLIEKVAKSNIRKNFAFNCIGTGISIFALGFLIPKIQYAITKKMTNENKFHTEEE